MRQQNNGRRRQNRGSQRRSYGNNNGNINKNTVIDSSGPDTRQRGTVFQLYEKYSSLASDATGSDDRILAESFLQFADHYYRLNQEIDLNNEARENRINAEKEINENKTNKEIDSLNETSANIKPPRRQRGFQANEKELIIKQENTETKIDKDNELQLDIK